VVPAIWGAAQEACRDRVTVGHHESQLLLVEAEAAFRSRRRTPHARPRSVWLGRRLGWAGSRAGVRPRCWSWRRVNRQRALARDLQRRARPFGSVQPMRTAFVHKAGLVAQRVRYRSRSAGISTPHTTSRSGRVRLDAGVAAPVCRTAPLARWQPFRDSNTSSCAASETRDRPQSSKNLRQVADRWPRR
jgi:hypothetical protein